MRAATSREVGGEQSCRQRRGRYQPIQLTGVIKPGSLLV